MIQGYQPEHLNIFTAGRQDSMQFVLDLSALLLISFEDVFSYSLALFLDNFRHHLP
jgi:hypothetical protein